MKPRGRQWCAPILFAVALGSCQPEGKSSTLLPAPGDVAAEVVAAESIELRWSPVQDAAGYDVYGSDSETGTFTKQNGTPVTGSSYVVSGLVPEKQYWYKVVALKGKKEQTPSAAVSGSTTRLWARTYGSGPDSGSVGTSVEPAWGGGYVVAGYSETYKDLGGEGGVTADVVDAWVLRLDEAGDVRWQKSYGGPKGDTASAIRGTRDEGYIVAGSTDSFGAGESDVWVLKLDASGGVSWQSTYGGSGSESASAVQQTSDHGYIVAGVTTSFGRGSGDFWVLKLAPDGEIDWQMAYGGPRNDEASSIQHTFDGGYVVAGYTMSLELPDSDAWVLKLAQDGAIEWQKAYGGRESDRAKSIRQTSDGAYIVCGTTSSSGGGRSDAWALRLSAEGEVSWSFAYGGEGDDSALCVELNGEGGYVLAGRWMPQNGYSSVWLLGLTADGQVDWQRAYANKDEAASIRITRGGYVLVGPTTSGSGHVWVMRLDGAGRFYRSGDTLWRGTPYDTGRDAIDTKLVASKTRAVRQRTEVTGKDTSAVAESFAP
jgi:hypothetical protein